MLCGFPWDDENARRNYEEVDEEGFDYAEYDGGQLAEKSDSHLDKGFGIQAGKLGNELVVGVCNHQ